MQPWNIIKNKAVQLFNFIKQNENSIKKYFNSYINSVVLFILILLFSSISYFITLVLLALFITSIINLIVNYRRQKNLEKKKLKSLKNDEI
jgi:ABC-type transport system involved in cytochrome bd biosynthesis fused ATPase/permease subunit